MATTVSKRFDALTGVRCLFAVMVFVYHNRKYWRTQLHPYLLQWINEFHVGVSLFFILSGLLIAFKYNAPGQRNRLHYGRYLTLRLGRIIPLYWLILLISYIDWGFPGPQKTWLTFSLLHGFSDLHNLDGIAQAWSLSVEFCFYLLAPFIFIYWNKRPMYAILLLLLLLAAVTGLGYGWHATNGNKQAFLYPFSFLLHSSFFGRFPEFLTGIYLAGILHGQHKDPFAGLTHKTWVGFVGVLLSLFGISFLQPDIFHHGFDTTAGAILQYTLVPFFALLWLYGLMTEQTSMSRLLSSKLFVLLGNASFAFYLVHISYVNLKLQRWHLLPDRNFVLLWIIAILLYTLLEHPLNKWIRRKVKGRKPMGQIKEEATVALP